MIGPSVGDSGAGGPKLVEQTQFVQQVRKEISKLFSDHENKLRTLQDCLLQRAVGRDSDKEKPVNPVDLLVPRQAAFDVKASIDDLYGAVETCLQRLNDQGSNAIPDIVSGAIDMLGWLVLLAVSETWLQDQAGLLNLLLSADHIAIPLETEAGTEVVFSRLRAKKPAKLKLGDDGVQIYNPNRLEWAELELGFLKTNQMTDIYKLIWKEVMKSEAQRFGDGELEELKETLQTRYERGENYYVVIRASSNNSMISNNAILTQLKSDFRHLCSFLIGIKVGVDVLVIPERRLVVLVREFLLMLRKYKP